VLAASGRSLAGGRDERARDLLVGSQAALVLVLLMAAGLLGKSFWRLSRVDPGFESVSTLLLISGALAAWLPARRATLIDPGDSLRHR